MKTFDEFLNEMAGLSNNKKTLINQIHRKIDPFTKGFFSDTGWSAVQQIMKLLNDMGLDWKMTGTNYDTSPGSPPDSMPNSKRWKFEINFINQNGRPDIIYGNIIASGAGPAENPLDRYDLTVTLS